MANLNPKTIKLSKCFVEISGVGDRPSPFSPLGRATPLAPASQPKMGGLCPEGATNFQTCNDPSLYIAYICNHQFM
jgi:hypothetical protein